MIIIDKDQISDKNGSLNITPSVVTSLIDRNEKKKETRERMYDYYTGKHDILRNERANPQAPNFRIVCNHAKYSVKISQGYMFGQPVSYTPAEGVNIDPLINEYDAQEISNCDSKLFKDSMIYGSAIELIYSNKKSRPRSGVLPPTQAFVVVDDTVEHNRLFGVQYYEQRDITDSYVTDAVAIVYTDCEKIEFHGVNKSFKQLEVTKRETHRFGYVPMIEYTLNDEEQCDYEQEIPLMDAYNSLMSERANDKAQFVDAFLFLKNIVLNTDEAKKLKLEKILISDDPNGDAKFLSQVLSEADVEVLRKAYKDDLHKYGMVPDLTDENFGNNVSGVALRYKIFGFEQNIKEKERYFCAGLKERIKIYSHFLSNYSLMSEVDPADVSIIMNRNLPQNDLEASEIVLNLKNTVSDETLLDRLDFVRDSKEELKLLRKQQDEEAKRRVAEEKQYLENTGYNQTPESVFNNLDEE